MQWLTNYLKGSEFCITAVNFKSALVRPGCMNYIHLIEEGSHTLGLSIMLHRDLPNTKRLSLISKEPLNAQILWFNTVRLAYIVAMQLRVPEHINIDDIMFLWTNHWCITARRKFIHVCCAVCKSCLHQSRARERMTKISPICKQTQPLFENGVYILCKLYCRCTKMIKKVMQMSSSLGIIYVKGTVFLYQENC